MKVYDSIAGSWSRLKTKPMSFVTEFLEGKSGWLLVTGCGSGRHSLPAAKQGFRIVGFDSSIKMIKIASKQDPISFYLVADTRYLPFKDGVFDYSLSVAVIHHLKPDQVITALRELKRVTKHESLISVWDHPELRGEHYIKWGKHKRYYYLYEREEFKKLITKVFEEFQELQVKNNFVFVTREP